MTIIPRACPTCASNDPAVFGLLEQPASTVTCTDAWHTNPPVTIDHRISVGAEARQAKWVADGGPEFDEARADRKAAAVAANGWDPATAAWLDIGDPATWAWDTPLHELLFYAAMGDLTPLADALHTARTPEPPEPTEAGPEPTGPLPSDPPVPLRGAVEAIIDKHSVEAAGSSDRLAASILHDLIHAVWPGGRRPEPTVSLRVAQAKRILAWKPPVSNDTVMLEAILATLFLHGRWKSLTKPLTTPEKERFADAVENWSARLNLDSLEDVPMTVDRWWR